MVKGIKRQKIKAEIKVGKQRYLRIKWLRYFGFGSFIIVLAIVCLNVFNSKEDAFKDKLNFESGFIQQIKVPLDSIIEVKGDKGTILRFNPFDLETKSGKKLSNDSLSVELIELTTKQDLLLANAQTVSNGKWLISGGAFKIDIKQGSNTLMLKEGKTVDIAFPKNTNEGNMELFYGDRDNNGDMNWSETNIRLKPNPYVVFISQESLLDTILTMKYGGVTTYRDVNVLDTIGHVNIKRIDSLFNDVRLFDSSLDTLLIWRHDKQEPAVSTDYEYESIDIVFDQISSNQLDELEQKISTKVYFEAINKQDRYFEYIRHKKAIIDNIYETTKLSKLGWINIDKFANDEEKVRVKLDFNIETDYDQIYLVDSKNNTILNVYNDKIDLPINRSFYIIVIGIKGKDIYGFKKLVRFEGNKNFKIEYRKIEESQLKSLLTIHEVRADEKETKPKKITAEQPKKKNEIAKKDANPQDNIVPVTIPQKAPQTIKIKSDKDTTIVYKEGTKITINANSFTNDKGTPIVGDVHVKVTEYYKLSDILLANLNSHCNDQLLETGGMLYIEAKQNNKTLKVATTKPIEISFPNKKKNMQLFYGELEDEIINWKPQQEDATSTANIPLDVDEGDVEVPLYAIDQPPIYPGCEDLSKNKAKKCFIDAIEKFVKRKFNTEIADDLGLKGRQRIMIAFKINRDGDIVDINTRSKNPYLEIEAERVIDALPKMIPGKQKGRSVSVRYSLPITFLVEGGTTSTSNNTKWDSVSVPNYLKDRLKGRDKRKVSVSDVNSYVLMTSKLGWINCDRFVRVKDKIKYKLKIKDADGEIKLSMIFKSWNAVLPSWRSVNTFDFRAVPNNEDVVIIAIKKSKGKLYFDVLPTKTVENPDIEFNFKEIDLEQLKNELRELDIMF